MAPAFFGGARVAIGDLGGGRCPWGRSGEHRGRGRPRVQVIDGRTFNAVQDFFAFPTDYRGGFSLAAADLDGDGLADVVAGSGTGMVAEVRALSGEPDARLLTSIAAFNSTVTAPAFSVERRESDRELGGNPSAPVAATDERSATSEVARSAALLASSSVVAGTDFVHGNTSGTRDGVGVNPVSGIELGPRGPEVLTDTDDGSIGILSLGFNFNLDVRSFSRVYVNKNGNLTFDDLLSRYNPEGFPQATPIVTPFWADVDTRGSLGSVFQSVGGSPRGRPYFQADWVNVGYYPRQADRRNDFSVDNEDDPAGDIVAFFYRGVQWTTGSATSGGAGGFGGNGAQIGFDSGNGSNFLSFARPASAADLSDLNNVQLAFRVGLTGTPEPIQLEAGAAGALVYLDANDNPVRDSDEPSAVAEADNPGTPNVNEAGRYRFDGLPAGNYSVRQELPCGFVGTAPAGGLRTIFVHR